MRFADVGKVFGIVEADAEVQTCHLILDAQMIDEVLHGIDKSSLAIVKPPTSKRLFLPDMPQSQWVTLATCLCNSSLFRNVWWRYFISAEMAAVIY